MSKLLVPADPATLGLVDSVLAAEYPSLAAMDPQIRICTLFALSDSPDKPALSKGGYAAAGMIRATTEEDRASGGPDVILLLDGDRWPRRSDEERYSLVHHELHHIVPVKLHQRVDDSGTFTCDLDGLGRPKIRMRKHDFEIGGFNVIVERHGLAAIEWQQIEKVHGAFSQQLLPFAKRQKVS